MERTKAYLKAATQEHCLDMAPFMRAEDVEEIDAASGSPPLLALLRAIDVSRFARTLLINEYPAAMWGVARCENMEDAGTIWLLTTYLVDAHPRAFFEHVRPSLEEALSVYPLLYNYVDCRYTKALRFAEHIGFEVRPPEKFGVRGLPHCPIILRREAHV